jgi:hypothetical protein
VLSVADLLDASNDGVKTSALRQRSDLVKAWC